MHSFPTSADAYDATQCDETVTTGQTLIVEAEGVVGLAWVWPVAVTVVIGQLHATTDDPREVIEAAGWTYEQIRDAVSAADARSFPVAAWARNWLASKH